MFCPSKTLFAYPATAMHFLRQHSLGIGLFALLCALTVGWAGFGGNAQSPTPAAEPQSVGAVANLTASVDGQEPGAVRLTWSEAENAQVHFVVYVKSAELSAGNYGSARMVPFAGSQGVVRGLDGGTSYSFIVIGMRWNWVDYGTVWGSWSAWVSATPGGSASSTGTAPAAEPQSVGSVANLSVSTDGQPAGAVQLTWSETGNAQVHFVVYVKSAELSAGNYGSARMAPFAGSQGVVRDLEGGTSYSFIVIGMRWNWVDYGTVWGSWSEWVPATPVASATDASTDRAALTALYNATGGATWTDNTNWLSDAPIGEWYGVNTDYSGRVTELNLDENGLTGQVPPELGDIENLTKLHLHKNNLTGVLPASLGDLSNLELLSLGGNQFTGTIPSAWENLSNLSEFYLWGSALDGPVPSWLGDLSGLEKISLHSNGLTGPIPPSLGNLSDLIDLRLHNNQLTGPIPSTLGNLSNLQTLLLLRNRLNGQIPAQLGNLSSIRILFLYQNQLTGEIPSSLGNLANLEEFSVRDNQLRGEIPPWLGNLSKLELLRLDGNEFTGPIPTTLGNLSNLQILDLHSNRLNGEIPPWLGNLAKLEWLRLDWNEFTGQIPNGLSRLSNVTFLVLSGNQLTGQIPSWLGNMTSLERLGLSDNRLSGEIPTTLGNLPNLRLIRLGGNSLTGCIPDSLQPVADNDFNRLGLPVCQAEPTASTGPSTGEGPYSIVNNDLDYSYTISLTNAWDQEREGVYSRTFPWSQLRVTSQYIETGTNLKNFSETVRSGLRDEWWPNASLFDISSVEEVQLRDVPSYRMRYRVQESPQYCLVDVEEAIVISDALPGYPKGFRVRAWMCESQVRAHGSERGETLDSFRIVTIPSPYYQQFIFTNGVTVKATDGVDPAALRAGADIVVTMLSGRQDLAQCMAQRGAALAIIPRDQPVTTLPEYAHLRGTYDFTGRSRDTFDLRGLGAAEPLHPVSSAGEEQLLGQFGPQHPYYPYRGWVAVHEFAHGIQNVCFTAADDIRWREFYVAALNANLYPGTHMMADVKEFFAAFSNGYFEVTDELGPDSTRDSLKTRFPSVFESLDAIYGGATLPQEYREIIPR